MSAVQKQIIGNYEVLTSAEQIKVNLKATRKGVIDALIAVATGIVISVFAYFLVRRFFTEMNWLVVLIAAGFVFFAIIKLVEGTIRLLTLSKDGLIMINMVKSRLMIKRSFEKSVNLDAGELSRIQFKGFSDDLSVGSKTLKRIYCSVSVVTKNDKLYKLLDMNTTTIVKVSDEELQSEVYKNSKKLATFLAKSLRIDVEWGGFTIRPVQMKNN